MYPHEDFIVLSQQFCCSQLGRRCSSYAWDLQVRISREKTSGKIFAVKKLDKAEMRRRGQVEHVKAERNVLAEVHNPYVVKLFYSFQVSHLYGSFVENKSSQRELT